MTALSLHCRIRDRDIDLEVTVGAGEVLAVLGPNGAGKSTALHVIAGLLHPDTGSVVLDGRTLTDTERGIAVPPHQRRVGLLLQKPLLFPHLDVLENVAFAPRLRRSGPAGRRQARVAARKWLDQVDAGDLAQRTPEQLSGGQAQRVAIARALAGEPAALLLDEPMAGLDVAVAASTRTVLRRVLATGQRPAVLVTHDILDVLTLADRVLVIEDGRVVERGSVSSVLAAPRSSFAARIAGINLVHGLVGPGGVLQTSVATWHGQPAESLESGAAAVALFHPAAVAVHARPPMGSPRNVIEVTVAELDVRGSAIRVRATPQADGAPGLAADITPGAAAELRLEPGARVWFAVKAQEVAVHRAAQIDGGF